MSSIKCDGEALSGHLHADRKQRDLPELPRVEEMGRLKRGAVAGSGLEAHGQLPTVSLVTGSKANRAGGYEGKAALRSDC
jgi:hypothetical protein